MGGVDHSELESLIESLAGSVAAGMKASIVEVRYVSEGGRRVLRVHIDKPGGVSLDDCATFSRALEARLDEADPIPESYYLEVSSPGLDRVLKRDRDYEIFRGRRVRLTTYSPPEGAPRGGNTLVGELLGMRDGMVVVRGDDGREWAIPQRQVAKARLHELGDRMGQATGREPAE